jgi:hypothetical protein
MLMSLTGVGNSIKTSRIPNWSTELVDLGERFSRAATENPDRRLSLALCLPRIDYAAALVGVGIMKSRIPNAEIETDEKRLQKHVGQWVSYMNLSGKTQVGTLEYCNINKKFKLQIYNKKFPEPDSMSEEAWRKLKPPKSNALWRVLNQEDLIGVHPTGKKFNPGRRVAKNQIKKITSETASISNLSELFGCELEAASIEDSGILFSVFGNKTRISEEVSNSLFPEMEARIEEVIRPRTSLPEKGIFQCTVETARSTMPDDDRIIVIIEADRSLPDQLVASRKFNRIVLLGRNAAGYDESARCVMQEFDNRREDCELASGSIEAIVTLSFYHK